MLPIGSDGQGRAIVLGHRQLSSRQLGLGSWQLELAEQSCGVKALAVESLRVAPDLPLQFTQAAE